MEGCTPELLYVSNTTRNSPSVAASSYATETHSGRGTSVRNGKQRETAPSANSDPCELSNPLNFI